ncbi:MAG: hypothetical protein IJD39_07930 [Clostridia bacterium]|nr:hypothetical protein [Clostridia bacterium]
MDHAALMFTPSDAMARLCFPKGLIRKIYQAEECIRRIPREDLSPAGLWLEDHARFLLEEAGALKARLRPAPRLPGKKTSRLLSLARAIIRECNYDISAPLILRHARHLTGDQEMEERELHFLPAALSIALFEQLEGVLSACIREEDVQRRAEKWISELSLDPPSPLPEDAALMQKILALLSEGEDARNLEKMDQMLALESARAEQSAAQAQEEMARMGLHAGRIIQSLHRMRSMPFDRIVDRLSPIAAILRKQDTYCRMDGPSRSYYHLQVCRIARKLHTRESAVARAALQLCEGKEGTEGEAGYYLIQRPDLIGSQLFHRKGPSFRQKHQQGIFIFLHWLGALIFLLLGPVLSVPVWLWPAIILSGSEITRIFLYRIFRSRFPARMLPRIRIRAIPKSLRTLVVVPTLLTSEKQALHMARQLSLLRHANPDQHLDFMLLGDFADAKKQQTEKDELILETAKEAISALNQSQGGGYFYLQRCRAFSQTQQCFSGRERKRGALEALNQLIVHGKTEDSFCYTSCDPRQLHRRYAFVITLDADTFLPPQAPHQLIGAMIHPLQKGRTGVIQPRMETGADTVKTRIQWFLGGRGGVDIYAASSQDLYQDVFGRGSFVGKGIYAPAEWLTAMEGRIPKERLLSHDLIEGEIAGSALAEDILLYDGHPSSLSGWQKRLHRWTRGDWQLLPFLRDKRFSPLSRHKIRDNLRRSLVPLGQMILLLSGTVLGHPLLCLMGLPWPLSGMGRRLLLLPGKAYTLADAIIRSLWRQFISKKGMLSWVTAAQSEHIGGVALPCLMAQLISGALLALFALMPGGFLPMAFLSLAWVISILLVSFMDRPIRGELPFTPFQKKEVRSLARDTWRFFEDSVTEDTLHLPPDNVQTDPCKGPAMRTSPTNIGLYMLSCCAARQLGFITTRDMAHRLFLSLGTLEKMEKWKGHLYNWYELHEGKPLPPRFVSAVDSGNLAGCLFACAQFCRQRLSEMDEIYQTLPQRLDQLFEQMDFSALYDREKHLFYVGWDGDTQSFTPAHYDLMASEARITSFVSVMKKDVPLRHWQHLNRATVKAGGGPALLSWGGTMFEYLMPALLLPHLPGTLLGESCLNAIRAQMSYLPRLPFGVSESGYYAFDPDLNYQYRAFGLPALAHSGETEGKVIAPYASMLALPFFPRAAAFNLQKMKKLGWADDHGLFEAADYTPQRVEGTPRLIKSHMAHHQGMILCAACNALSDQALIRTFMAPPAAKAYQYLLMEKAPRRAKRRPILPPPRQEREPAGEPGRFPRSGLPVDAHALQGKGLTWLITAGGQGYLAADEMMITRFREEAGSQTGPQFYLRDAKCGAYCRPLTEGRAYFAPGLARYDLEWQGLRIQASCCVSPLSGVAIAILRIDNPGKEERELDAVSFLEIAQGPMDADAAHPNFRDLSVRISPYGENGLISHRLSRDESENVPAVIHTVSGDFVSLRRQGDRLAFLGRKGSYARPLQLTQPSASSFRLGDVIAPCLSLWAGMRIAPGASGCLYFQTAATHEETPSLPFTPDQARAALSLSLTQARMALRFLRLDASSFHLAQQILGAISFYGQPHQSVLPAAPLNALWQFGISGRLPMLLILPSSEGDKGMIRRLLHIHAWLRMQGVKTDLVFFCKEKEGYHKPLQDMIAHLVSLSPDRDMTNVSGGAYLLSGTDEQMHQLQSLARLTLHGGASLARQISALRISLPQPHPAALTAPQPLQPPPLAEFNGCGGFSQEMDYWILSPGPAPWHNLICNEKTGVLASDGGILSAYYENSRLGRITRPVPDVHRDMPSEEMLLHDGSGDLFSLTDSTAVHEPGITAYYSLCGEIQARISLFAPPGLPVTCRMITLHSTRETSIRLTWLVRFSLGERPESTRCQGNGDFVTAENGEVKGLIFAGLKGSQAQAVSPAVCFGLQGASLPLSLSSPGNGPGSIGLFSLEKTLKAHETLTLFAVLGHAGDHAEMHRIYDEISTQGSSVLRSIRAWWQEKLTGITLYSADFRLNCMMNRWLPYQTLAARLMARMGPYQAGGAFGFRDQLQDLLSLLHTQPEFAKNHILLCASHQFQEGDVQHWWHAPRRGVRTRISDDKLFLPYLTALYIRITGDESILQEKAPYLDAPPLAEHEDDRYDEPSLTDFEEPLVNHCIRAIDSVSLGIHDLPLMGSGDWNDGMNRVGGRKGESVWLGFFLALVLKEFSPFCPGEIKDRYDALRRKVLEGAENAWTGQWYLRAWYDTGEPMGGPRTDPPRIDLISQCFAALAGAPRDHARLALRHAVHLLYDRNLGLVKLLDPPFAPEERAGYIGGYLPGIRENGGQYTHAAPWLVMALCKIGEYDLVWEIAGTLLPAAHGDTNEKIQIYKTEPYVLCGDVYAGENAGRGGWSWYTGSAAWLYYVYLTVLLGFEKQGEKARLHPCPHSNGEEYTLVYRAGSASYHFTAGRDIPYPTLDGEKLPDGWVSLRDDGRTHEARFPLRIS